MEKLANELEIKNVLDLLDHHGLDPFDVVDADGINVILSINDAIDQREDIADLLSSHPDSQDYNDIVNDIDRMKDLKREGYKYIYIYDDIYTTNGACGLVSADAFKDFKSWAVDCVKGDKNE